MGDVGARRPAAGSEDIAGAGRRRGLRRPSQKGWSGGPRERREGSDRAQPSLATVRAAVDIGPEHAREEGLESFGFGRCRSRRIAGGPAGDQVLGVVAIGEEAIVAGSA
jgi:hypothetical protein